MNLSFALEQLRQNRHRWKAFGVRRLYIFGSVADESAHPESDVDILVDFAKPQGLFRLIRVRQVFEDILKRRVDVVTRDALKGPLRESVLRNLVEIE